MKWWFWSPLMLVRERSLALNTMRHVTPDTGMARCAEVYYSPMLTVSGRRTWHTHRSTLELRLGTEWTNRVCGRQALQYQGVGVPPIPTGGCNWLAWITSWAGREIKPFRVRTRWNAAGPADRGLVGSGETFPLGGGISGRQENSCLDLGACEARRCQDGIFNFRLTVCWPSFQCLSVNYISFSSKLPIYVF